MTVPNDKADAEVKAAIVAAGDRPSVTSALRDVAIVCATEGGRAAAAWRALADAIGVTLGIAPIAAAPSPEDVPPIATAAGFPALAAPQTGVVRTGRPAASIPPPVASTGGRAIATGARPLVGVLETPAHEIDPRDPREIELERLENEGRELDAQAQELYAKKRDLAARFNAAAKAQSEK